MVQKFPTFSLDFTPSLLHHLTNVTTLASTEQNVLASHVIICSSMTESKRRRHVGGSEESECRLRVPPGLANRVLSS